MGDGAELAYEMVLMEMQEISENYRFIKEEPLEYTANLLLKHENRITGKYKNMVINIICNQVIEGSEDKLLDALSKKEYREKSKLCCEFLPEFSRAEKALMRLVERTHPNQLDMDIREIMKELKAR